MEYILEFDKYDPKKEYISSERRSLNLSRLRRTKEYRTLLKMGFVEDSSHQQELNNTLKFKRTRKKENQLGHDDVFYTIHPTGIVRRYNPMKSEETPEGFGNDIKNFFSPFKNSVDYIKALRYLISYLRRKEQRGDFR